MWKRTLIIKIAVLALLIGLVVICVSGGSSPKSADWQASSITPDGTVAGYPLGSVIIGDPKQVGDDVRIHMVDALCGEQECRIIALGIDGQTHLGEKIVRLDPGGNFRSTVAVFAGIDLEDIQEFRFQARPCREETGEVAAKSQLSNAARKRRLIDEISENRFFESSSVN